MNELNLFELKTTFIVKDDIHVNLTIPEIFDSTKYTHFYGVTFSASPNFINKYLADFKIFSLMVGINENELQDSVNKEITRISFERQIEDSLNQTSTKLYKQLNQNVKQAIGKNEFTMMVPTIGYTVHSKFYLLWNESTSESRLILGSANLSDQAFNNNQRQLEEVIIFDNNEALFDIYYDRFVNEICSISTGYFPERLLKIANEKMNMTGNQEKVSEVIQLRENDLEEIKRADIVEKISDIDKKIALGILPTNIPEEIMQIPEAFHSAKEKNTRNENAKNTQITYSLVREVISKSKIPKIVKKHTLENKIMKKVIKQTNVADNKSRPKRPELYTFPEERNSSKVSGLFVPDSIDEKKLLPFGRKATKVEIKHDLKVIQQIMESYEEFTYSYEDNYGQRIYEAILYAFTAPFIFDIKHRARTEPEKQDIPQFMFLGGASNSGKSSLLKIISKMISVTNKKNGEIEYERIIPYNEKHNRSANIIAQLDTWLTENNIFPLLIDEIPTSFFTGEKGGELVVNLTNLLSVEENTYYPVLIGTTNAETYSFTERARRRSYYLINDKPFDEEKKEDSGLIFSHILENITTNLFQDFVLEMSSRLQNEQYYWSHFEGKGKNDFLFNSREIFKEYYRMLEEPLPIYFPTQRYDDAAESAQEKWRKLFLGASQGEFHYNKSTDTMIFKITSLDKNLSIKYTELKPSIIYKNALSKKVVVGSMDSIDLELNATLFFHWIGIPHPYKRKWFRGFSSKANK